MKTFAIATALAVFATGAVAKNCNGGLSYCASSLLAKGDYGAQINEALSLAHQTDPQDAPKALFFCEGGSDGAIVFTNSCAKGCLDGGKGQDDFCAS